MKFSYSTDHDAYVVTEHGVVVDFDPDPTALRARHGICEVEDDSVAEAEAMADALLLTDFGVAPKSDDDDDDLDVIREFLED